MDLSKISIGIVGLTRNSEKTIFDDVVNINNAFKYIKNKVWFIVESDSSDKTVDRLKEIKKKIYNFNYVSLGNLEKKLIKRTERLAYCRNIYLKEININKDFNNISHIAVVDFDNINNLLNYKSVNSCFKKNFWDVCTSNQLDFYYDIYALRHHLWSPTDCWKQFDYYNKYRIDVKKNLFAAVTSKIFHISQKTPWIEVDSAFGGIALYKKKIFKYSVYSGIDLDGSEICEHVPFHLRLKKKKFRIFINPKFINSSKSDNLKILKKTYIFKLTIYFLIKNLIFKFFSKKKSKKILNFLNKFKNKKTIF